MSKFSELRHLEAVRKPMVRVYASEHVLVVSEMVDSVHSSRSPHRDFPFDLRAARAHHFRIPDPDEPKIREVL